MNLFILPTDTCFWIAVPISEIDSYETIYKIKSRDLSKPLTLLCYNFEYLEKNSSLNLEQIGFLKKYKNPFTILINKNKILDKFLLEQIEKLPNSEIYEKIAFRVAHNFMHKKLIELNWLLFLTSANKAGNPELFTSIKIKKEFKTEIKNLDIKVLAHNDFSIKSRQKSSDIFEFIWDDLSLKYLRKN